MRSGGRPRASCQPPARTPVWNAGHGRPQAQPELLRQFAPCPQEHLCVPLLRAGAGRGHCVCRSEGWEGVHLRRLSGPDCQWTPSSLASHLSPNLQLSSNPLACPRSHRRQPICLCHADRADSGETRLHFNCLSLPSTEFLKRQPARHTTDWPLASAFLSLL